MPDKITTIEELARITQEEFAALRSDIRVVRTNMETGFRAIIDSLDLIRQDLADTRRVLSMLAQTIGGEIGELRNRVERIEKHLGLVK